MIIRDGPSPQTHYARNGSLNIAYQTIGSGPVDLVLVPGFISHIEHAWNEPLLASYLRQMASFCRVIMFDKRGMGLSDRDSSQDTPTLEQRVDDVLAVLDAVDSRRTAVLAWSEGGPTAISACAAHPDRFSALILFGTTARFSSAPDFTEGIPWPVLELFVDTLQEAWGSGIGLELYAPSLADDAAVRQWWSAYQRFAATPGAVAASLRMHFDVDLRSALADLGLATLVLHQTQDLVVPVECGRYLAKHIRDAKYVELPGTDHMFWVGNPQLSLRAIRDFLVQVDPSMASTVLTRRLQGPSHGWHSLTNTELEVARLVARGWTSRQIADRLVVSPRTTESHVAHILTKLGLHRRAEIAAEVTRREGKDQT